MNKEAQASLNKAFSKLEDAQDLDASDFPGLVINTSYYAMHHAAVAVLQQRYGDAPLKLNQVTVKFAEYLENERPERSDLGEALNRAFNARVAEDYGVIDDAESEEALEIRADAERLVSFAESIVDGSGGVKLF